MVQIVHCFRLGNKKAPAVQQGLLDANAHKQLLVSAIAAQGRQFSSQDGEL
jgi:hypothetical protein